MTATCFGFLPKTIFRMELRGFLIYSLQCLIYRVIKKDGHNFVSPYFKTRNSDKYDVNYI
jgi:hypothetical protein